MMENIKMHLIIALVGPVVWAEKNRETFLTACLVSFVSLIFAGIITCCLLFA